MASKEGTTALKTRDWEEMAALLDQHRQAYALLLSLSRGQRGAFEQGGSRGLMKVIARKQKVIHQLESIDAKLVPYTSSWEATMAALPGPARRQVKAVVTEISGLIRDIIESERDMERRLVLARDALGEKARSVSTGLVAARAYEKPGLAAAGRILNGEG